MFKAIDPTTGVGYAVKAVAKEGSEAQVVARECCIMRQLNHPNILRLHTTLEDGHTWYLVTELCVGGELFGRLREMGTFTEAQALVVMRQILSAVRHMHSRSVAHCDLKPENFLLKTDGPVEGNTVKLIDFGLSQVCRGKGVLEGVMGNPYYVAPQVLSGCYDIACDMWSCGALLYLMLVGYPPFFGETYAEVLAKVRVGWYEFHESDWRHISNAAKTLVTCLLTTDVEKRYTARQAVNSQWVRGRLSLYNLIDSLS